jgi:hypothetical protein
MTKKISFFVVTVAAVTLVLSGCGKGPGMDMEPDDMATVLPHIGTWYFADPMPDDAIPVPPGARLVLTATGFTLAMGDDMETTFTLFETPGVTKFEVKGTYTIGADGSTSFNLLDPPTSAVEVEPVALALQIAPKALAAVATIPEDATAMVVIDPATPNIVTISGDFMPTLLNLPGVTAVSACKDMACPADGGTTQ